MTDETTTTDHSAGSSAAGHRTVPVYGRCRAHRQEDEDTLHWPKLAFGVQW